MKFIKLVNEQGFQYVVNTAHIIMIEPTTVVVFNPGTTTPENVAGSRVHIIQAASTLSIAKPDFEELSKLLLPTPVVVPDLQLPDQKTNMQKSQKGKR